MNYLIKMYTKHVLWVKTCARVVAREERSYLDRMVTIFAEVNEGGNDEKQTSHKSQFPLRPRFNNFTKDAAPHPRWENDLFK